jgi:hypothetical protein
MAGSGRRGPEPQTAKRQRYAALIAGGVSSLNIPRLITTQPSIVSATRISDDCSGRTLA